MLTALSWAAVAAIGLGLVLLSAWLSSETLKIWLWRRGAVWHVSARDRRRRIAAWPVIVGALLVLPPAIFLLVKLLLELLLSASWWLIGDWVAKAGAFLAPYVSAVASRLRPFLAPILEALGPTGFVILTAMVIVAAVVAYRIASDLGRTVSMGERLIRNDASPGEPLTEAPGKPLPELPPEARGRRIVILCDGTGNRPPDADDPSATNVWKIGQALVRNDAQTVWYTAGVGSGNSQAARRAADLGKWASDWGLPVLPRVLGWAARLQTAWEGATGTGIGAIVLEAYTEIARQYRPGDRIYIIGFSRGAYAARSIVGAIRRCGLLKPSNLRYAPAMISLYRSCRGRNVVPVREEFVWRDVPIEMLGVFDTVASLGAPLWGWWFSPRGTSNRALNTSPMPNCRHVYHALSMDERRATFFPTLFYDRKGTKSGWTATLEQVWFRGVHSDVGGGYAETGLSDITLGWMLDRAARHGLELRPDARAALRPDCMAQLHDETANNSFWNWIGTWPRWAQVLPGPPSRNAGISVHPTVFERARRLRAEAGRYDLHDLSPGETASFRTEAQRQWDRTGLILQGGEGGGPYYRLRWKSGVWRDSACPPCGPAGNLDGDKPGDPRWRLRSRRRLRDAPWMTLCATLAGPRRWRLRELPLRLAFAYLFLRDPRLLLQQVAPIGSSLRVEGDSILIRSERPASLLYLFANDLWQTYPNNSGELELELTRLEGEPAAGEALWLLPDRGPWRYIMR